MSLIFLAKYLNKKVFYPALSLLIIAMISWGFLNPKKLNHQVSKFQAGDVRLVLWDGCIDMIKDNLIFGVGQKHFGEKFTPYDTIEHKKHQTIGICLDKKNKEFFAKEATSRGIERITEVGKMSVYDYPWDSMYPMNRFIRWVSLN